MVFDGLLQGGRVPRTRKQSEDSFRPKTSKTSSGQARAQIDWGGCASRDARDSLGSSNNNNNNNNNKEARR